MPRPTTALDITGVSTYNNMLALDGSKKLFCTGCGGPRDVKFAETNACGCCGSFGTQKVQPLFDEHGERLTDAEVLVIREKERLARVALKAVEPVIVEQPKPAKPTKVVARTSARQPNVQVLPQAKPITAKARKLAAASTLASLF